MPPSSVFQSNFFEIFTALKRQSCSQLPDSRSRAAESSGSGDLPEIHTIDIGRVVEECWLRKLCVVQRVEKLHAKFQAQPLGDCRGLRQRNVKIHQTGATQNIACDSVGAVFGIVDRIKLRKTRVWLVL